MSQPVSRIPRHPSLSELDELSINTIRCLCIDAIEKARSGHPGITMGMAPAAYVLWTRHLRHNPSNPRWVNRDRFVLSAGHGCMLLYSLLHLTGYPMSLDDIKQFRQWGSPTPGHPEYGHTPGVEVTTGPLGQGISNAVGMAVAEKYLEAFFNTDGYPVIDYRIYVIAGDGCLQEGVAAEACSLAGHLGLNNLIVLYDDNRISIDGSTSLSFSEDVAGRFEAYGWFVQTVDGDGNDMGTFERALVAAKAEQHRPSLIKLRTHIGFGSPNKQDTHEAHGSPLGPEEIVLTKQRYGWDPGLSFHIPDEALSLFRQQVTKGRGLEEQWRSLFKKYAEVYPEQARRFSDAAERRMPAQWEDLWRSTVPVFEPGKLMATREAQGKVLDAILPHLPLVIGGSADLTPSNNTRFKGAVDFSKTQRNGRYLRFGVREHAMAALVNGIAVSDLLVPFGATFFCFVDYMRAAVRLAALSQYPSIFVFTHDSIGLGEDGPTHQAVEQFASLRCMPGLTVIRPADANETAMAWKFALEHRSGPVVLALTRQKLPVLDRKKYAPAEGLVRGAYTLCGSPEPEVLLIGTGSETSIALAAYDTLSSAGVAARVVSMPSWDLFEAQTESYRHEVLPPAVTARVAVEAGVGMGWERYLGTRGVFIGMKGYGASAPYETVYRNLGITADAVVDAARRLLV